ncbi:septation protein SepH [Actinoallomurus purpureus]|uniref:septation protein SepH n=1 Tax=Actinoallomurus purpureus TaxID=478114 RepID=UPI002092AC47|nr:septation protein SepH [Actinoallomurus purpureus]MCO6011127.1 septation protein SepH [Actinoallomurus purpureus]
MQELRLVAVSEDGSYLVLATAGRGTRFTLPIDDRLRAVVRGHFSRLGQYEIEVESPLRPKEIQARIRAGETAEEIAETAGIPVERVRWFEGPVLQEREYMAQQAQRVPIRRPGESSPAPALGEIVEERLGRRGIDLEEVEWDSRKCEDSTWRVSLSFYYDGRPYSAEWAYDPRRRHLSAVNDEAARLSSLDLDESVDDTVTPFLPRRAMKVVGDPLRDQAPPPAPVPVPAPSRYEEFPADEPVVFREVPKPAPEEPAAFAPRPREARPEIVARPQELPAPTRPAPPAPEPAPAPARPEPVAPPAAEHTPARPEPIARPAAEPAPVEPEPVSPPAAERAPIEPEPAAAEAAEQEQPEQEAAEARPQAPKPIGPKPLGPKPLKAEPAATTKPAVAKPAAAQKPAQARPAAQKPAAQKPAQKPAEKPAEKVADRPAAAAAKPATPPAAPEKRPPARKKARSKRASVPSWDEIMFGARRPE